MSLKIKIEQLFNIGRDSGLSIHQSEWQAERILELMEKHVKEAIKQTVNFCLEMRISNLDMGSNHSYHTPTATYEAKNVFMLNATIISIGRN